MPTMIPPTVFAQILQTNSSPVTIAALLNEAESTYSSTPKRSNAKRVYPFWKICEVCLQPYPCQNRAQALRNRTCSKECANKLTGAAQMGKTPPEQREGMVQVTCAVCGAQVWKPRAWIKRIKAPTCSKRCNGVLRGKDWAKHGHKGRSGWTAESEASYQEKMTGPNNPAWKGGVTYFKTHGNYTGVKYVRCPAEYREMARKDGYVMEHRLFVAQAMGRILLRSEVVHHKDHNPTNNALSNLQLFVSNAHHKRYEARGSPLPLWQL
jgi:endogenous inhibitor of DNA gyrase (YacG/DUF329 family)